MDPVFVIGVGNFFATLGVISAVWRYTLSLERRMSRVEALVEDLRYVRSPEPKR